MDTQERLCTELELLESMYPEQVNWNSKAREIKYTTDTGSFELRIPDGYLKDALPDVLSANLGKHDLRNKLKTSISEMEVGEENLDSIISTFNDLTENLNAPHRDPAASSSPQDPTKATVIIYLHHLLNTNKKKQALSPPSASVSGVTKPGYPGVLIYSGPSKDVWEHVNELKGLNWQAFQVRLESEEEWEFKHGPGVKEVEGMGDVVAEIDVEEGRKEVFMQSMRMK